MQQAILSRASATGWIKDRPRKKRNHPKMTALFEGVSLENSDCGAKQVLASLDARAHCLDLSPTGCQLPFKHFDTNRGDKDYRASNHLVRAWDFAEKTEV